MKRIGVLLLPLVAAGCFGGPKEKMEVITPPAFVMDDCALISTVGHDHYKLGAGMPQMRLRLHGEGLPWKPPCNWQALGFNVVEDTGPESREATKSLSEIAFWRPRYDVNGVLVRATVTPPAGQEDIALCRLVRTDATWTIQSCGEDKRAAAPPPSPTDATPDGKIPAPVERPPTARDVGTLTPDPGRQP